MIIQYAFKNQVNLMKNFNAILFFISIIFFFSFIVLLFNFLFLTNDKVIINYKNTLNLSNQNYLIEKNFNENPYYVVKITKEELNKLKIKYNIIKEIYVEELWNI